jgi:hypothetical protein
MAPMADHGDTTGHRDSAAHDDHAHAEPALGPIDRASWSMALLGLVLGLAVAIAFIQAAS